MSAEDAAHPDVQRVVEESNALAERLLNSIDKMRSVAAERVSDDDDIAVKVDMLGQLVDLWFKPGLLDRKDPKVIAKEVTALSVAAVKDAAARMEKIVDESHDSDGGAAVQLPASSETPKLLNNNGIDLDHIRKGRQE